MSEAEVRKECIGQSNGALVESLVVLMAGFVRQKGELADRDKKIKELRSMVRKEQKDHLKTLKQHSKYLEAQL